MLLVPDEFEQVDRRGRARRRAAVRRAGLRGHRHSQSGSVSRPPGVPVPPLSPDDAIELLHCASTAGGPAQQALMNTICGEPIDPLALELSVDAGPAPLEQQLLTRLEPRSPRSSPGSAPQPAAQRHDAATMAGCDLLTRPEQRLTRLGGLHRAASASSSRNRSRRRSRHHAVADEQALVRQARERQLPVRACARFALRADRLRQQRDKIRTTTHARTRARCRRCVDSPEGADDPGFLRQDTAIDSRWPARSTTKCARASRSRCPRPSLRDGRLREFQHRTTALAVRALWQEDRARPSGPATRWCSSSASSSAARP